MRMVCYIIPSDDSGADSMKLGKDDAKELMVAWLSLYAPQVIKFDY